MAERNLSVDHTTVWRWVQRYAPELNRRVRRDILEAGLVLMIDDNLREAFLSGGPLANRKRITARCFRAKGSAFKQDWTSET